MFFPQRPFHSSPRSERRSVFRLGRFQGLGKPFAGISPSHVPHVDARENDGDQELSRSPINIVGEQMFELEGICNKYRLEMLCRAFRLQTRTRWNSSKSQNPLLPLLYILVDL